jgi:hypothetical protein
MRVLRVKPQCAGLRDVAKTIRRMCAMNTVHRVVVRD